MSAPGAVVLYDDLYIRRLDRYKIIRNVRVRKVFHNFARQEVARIRVMDYPPELPGQKYKRTFRLRRRITFKPWGLSGLGYGVIHGLARNPKTGYAYSQRVVGWQKQDPRWFKGRWWVVYTIIENRAHILLGMLNSAFQP